MKKLYVLTFEPYHENSTVLGVYDDFDEAMKALEQASDGKNPPWDNSDCYDLQEWCGGKKTRHWSNFNPYEGWPTRKNPVKLGWRIEEQEVPA